MAKLCERPGCSEPGAAEYGMVPEDLLFWIDALAVAADHDAKVLCRRHADAMTVPVGWTLDDRRDPQPRLFRSRPSERPLPPPRQPRPPRVDRPPVGEQLQIDGTGELPRPTAVEPSVVAGEADGHEYEPWLPEFDDSDDLDGLLEVKSPLLARAFQGTDRPRRR